MLWFFYILGGLALLEGVASLIAGVRFHRFVVQTLQKKPTAYAPKVTVILPFRGMEAGLAENLRALAGQDYPDYEILFVTDRATDAAYAPVQRIVEHVGVPARLLVAGPAAGRGQKVHNLLYAVARARPDTEVLVFADSDARPHRTWLRRLVAPLSQASVGVATGYRWYLPVAGGFWSLVQSAWNAGILTLLGDHGHNFAWGGAMAVRVTTFRQAQVAKYWDRALSDDYAITNAVRRAGLSVAFVPQCLTVTYQDTTGRALREWSRRQVIITRVYAPHLWKLSWLSQSLYLTVLVTGLGWSVARGLGGASAAGPLGGIAALLLLGLLKGHLRLRSVERMLPEHAAELRRYAWGYRLLAPFMSWLTLYALCKSATTRRIGWRGITYELRSPFDTRIVDGAPHSLR